MSVETGTKRKAENDELFPDENENKRKFLEASKNWSDLPAEMKMHCIKWMNFDTRCQLRRTSRTEKQLVERKRYPIDDLDICIRRCDDEFRTYLHWAMQTAIEIRERVFNLPATRKDLSQLEMIFRLGDIKSFEFHNISRYPYNLPENPFLHFPSDIVPKVEDIYLRQITKDALPFLRQCTTPQSITFAWESNIPSAQVFSLPNVQNTPHVFFVRTASFPYPVRLIEKWIEKDCQLGQKLHVHCAGKNVFGIFLKKFKDRIIFQTDDMARIYTNNKEKHVFLIGDFQFSGQRTISCGIVPSNVEDNSLLCRMVAPVKNVRLG